MREWQPHLVATEDYQRAANLRERRNKARRSAAAFPKRTSRRTSAAARSSPRGPAALATWRSSPFSSAAACVDSRRSACSSRTSTCDSMAGSSPSSASGTSTARLASPSGLPRSLAIGSTCAVANLVPTFTPSTRTESSLPRSDRWRRTSARTLRSALAHRRRGKALVARPWRDEHNHPRRPPRSLAVDGLGWPRRRQRDSRPCRRRGQPRARDRGEASRSPLRQVRAA